MKHLVWFLLVLGAAYGTQQYYQRQYEPQAESLQSQLNDANAQQKEAVAQTATAQAKLAEAERQASQALMARDKSVKEAAAAHQADVDRIEKLTADLTAARAASSPASKPSAEAPGAPAAMPSGTAPVETAESKRIADLQERLRTNQAARDTLQATLAQKQQALTAWEAQGANHRKGTDLPVQISTLQKQLEDVLQEIEVVQKQLPPGN